LSDHPSDHPKSLGILSLWWTALLICFLLGTTARAADDWPEYGRDAGGSQYSPLSQVNRDNVAKLEVAWVHHSGDFAEGPFPVGTSLQVTPIQVNGLLYYCTPMNRVFALDPATGKERWIFDPHAPAPDTGKPVVGEPRRNLKCKGVSYWHDPTQPAGARCAKRIFKGDVNGFIYAMDADTGWPCRDFGAAKGHPGYASHKDYPNYGEGPLSIQVPPVIVGDLVVVGIAANDGIQNANDGFIRAFDARSGELRWEFDPIPTDKRELTGAANVWSTMSADLERGLVFVPTTSPSTDYYGGERKFDMPLVSALVALSATDGHVVWSFQTIHHDLFDYDHIGQALLVDIRKDGRTIPAALLQTKMGYVFAFDRTNGTPLWPIVEKPVPQSDVPGEASAPTQPIPTGIATFARQTLTRDDLGLTPIDGAWCRKKFDSLRYEGMYTPPSERGSLLFPSALGGGNWGGAAYDPVRNLLIVKGENLATIIRIVKKTDAVSEDKAPIKDYLTRPLRGTPYRVEGEVFMSPFGIPCTPPPWGTLTAIDMATGKRRWQVPMGQATRAGLLVPESFGWGAPNAGGPMLTGGGLLFVGATVDSKFRAFDTETGKELWQVKLPVPGMAVPMTYEYGGRQYVVIAAGGHSQINTKTGDSIIAYALP
jgi:quinoprotein glucose dehydrogenase